MTPLQLPAFAPHEPTESFKGIVRWLVSGYEFDIQGLYRKDGSVLPLPAESSVVGKIVESSLISHLHRRLLLASQLESIPATSDRVYPDITFSGPAIAPHRFAVDIKCARRTEAGDKTKSAIAIGTFDAEYFHYPREKTGNIMMPYGNYSAHLSLVALYDYVDATARNVELLVVEKWRVATRKSASGTRCYIAATNEIERIRKEDGDFESEREFHRFWRSEPVKESKRQKWQQRHGY